MVDTVILRVHNLIKYRDLKKFINREFVGSKKMRANINRTDIDEFCKNDFNDESMAIDYLIKSGKGKSLLINSSKHKLNNSGHYLLNARELPLEDCIEFNFSIPKYVFGTNIMMFVEHQLDKDFKYHQNKELRYNLARSYDLFMKFVNGFFKREFPEIQIDLRDIEINRIDLCFNQVFRTKDDALRYLEYQKKIRRKHSRKDNDRHIGYDTSINFVTKRYSVKVYHKGSEYAKNDKKEHKRLNKSFDTEMFNVEELQKLADRILRYEVTFRKGMLSYLFSNGLFRKSCPYHNNRYRIYKKVASVKEKNDRIAKKIGSMKYEKSKEKFKANNPYISIDKSDNYIYREMSKEVNKSRQFMYLTDDAIDQYNSVTPQKRSPYNENRAKFSRKLFKLLADYFIDFVEEFQVKEIPALETLKRRIDEYNNKYPGKLYKEGMIKLYYYLVNYTFDQIQNMGIYSRATIYRYKKMFELVGVTKNNFVVIEISGAKVNLSEYHSFILDNRHLFRLKYK